MTAITPPDRTIRHRGTAYSLHKHHTNGTSERTLLAEETLDKIKPYFSVFGLTRLANITGLDRSGIPVTVAIRPNSYSLVQSSGKGTSLTTALASAAMESIEVYCAEHIHQLRIAATYSELTTHAQTIDLHKLDVNRHALFHSERVEEWLLGWDIVQQQEVAVPYHSVTLDFRLLTQMTCPASFIMSSNGLASGNHFLEALLSGLYELIERDGITCHGVAERYGWKKQRVWLEHIEDETIQRLLTLLRSQDLAPIMLDCTTDLGVPTFEAYLYDLRSNLVPVSRGYGAHLNPATAITRALTEAVQGRTVVISGARDDLFKDLYDTNRFRYTHSVKNLQSNASSVSLRYTDSTCTTFEADVWLILERLKQAGLEQVIVFDLSPEAPDISVLRVIVPGLEGYPHYNYHPKARSYRFAERVCGPGQVAHTKLHPFLSEVSTHSPAGGVL